MLKDIALAEIIPSPTNPRKTFDQAKLEELARSIAEKGLIQPLVVRPHQNGGGSVKYELVAGERRYRASKIAQAETALCLVRELTDVEVLEIQTIENLQRDDLHPLEEAQGYADLMKHARYDVAQIAEKIGKSGKYVYDRIKLLQLTPELQTVFLEGEITAGHAILLARLSPSDQKEVFGRPAAHGSTGGLFVPELSDALELKDKRRRKAISVRELETWINDHVRFDPAKVDLPNLFPATAAVLAAAAEEELKVVKITHDYRVPDAARDQKERTYGRPSWKRADGEADGDGIWEKRHTSKTCEHSILGVVVAGPGRGDAFRVCVAKKKCKIHWAQEMREAARRAKRGAGGTGTAARDDYRAQQQKYEEQRKEREREAARWEKAEPQLLEALAAKLKEAPTAKLVDVVIGALMDSFGRPRSSKGAMTKYLERGKTLEDAIRYGAFLILGEPIMNQWGSKDEVAKNLKTLGIDAHKIVDQVAPKPKPEKKPAAEKAGTKTSEKPKQGARARRRGKSADAVKPKT